MHNGIACKFTKQKKKKINKRTNTSISKPRYDIVIDFMINFTIDIYQTIDLTNVREIDSIEINKTKRIDRR